MLEYVHNPAVMVMQRRLFAPNYEGPGKWVLFDASTRRSFLAIRQQEDFGTGSLPGVLRLLLDLQDGQLSESAQAKLVDSGLLLPRGSVAQTDIALFDLFQMSVFDYPFLDYSTSAAFAEDGRRMARYADSSLMPSAWTDRRGPSVPLPPVAWSDLTPAEPGAQFSLKELAAALRFTFGAVGVLGRGPNSHIRKTSPSGGAKHPTEGWVHVAAPWDGLDAGSYVYDGEAHRLVRDVDPYSSQRDPERCLLSVSVRSRVERAMWRYRDARSSRAVLIDAGHIVETLTTLLVLFGATPSIRTYPLPSGSLSGWLLEPEVARITFGRETIDWAGPTGDCDDRTAPATADSGVLTNPAMYFTIHENGLMATTVHPAVRAMELDAADFQILTHCIRSHRGEPSRPGDRRTTPEALGREFGAGSQERVARLLEYGALLDTRVASGLYEEARRWAESGWYLPFLMWLGATNTAAPAPALSEAVSCASPAVLGGEVSSALRRRVTTRSFSSRRLTKAHALQLLDPIATLCQEQNQTEIYIAGLKVDGLDEGSLHAYDLSCRTLTPLHRTITPANLAAITIGQPWVYDSAVALWVVVTPCTPSEFFPSHIILGRIAQRICLRAARDGVGVFQTPAVRDLLWCHFLGLSPDPARVLYEVCLGWPSALGSGDDTH